MAIPSKKSTEIEELVRKVFNIDRTGSIKANKCVMQCSPNCNGTADKFRDARSAREYTISRLCQKCQDDIFGV